MRVATGCTPVVEAARESAEMQSFSEGIEAALHDGTGVYAFTMFVASGTRPS